MKFVSKQQNLSVTLKPSFPGNHLTGTPPVNGISARFKDGILEVKDENIIELLKLHPGFNLDYIAIDEDETDPFMYMRNDSEPSHVIQEINYGHVEKSVGNKKPFKLSPDIRKALQDEAMEMAKKMLPGMLEQAMKEIINSRPQEDSVDESESDNTDNVKVENVKPTSTKSNKKSVKTETNVKMEDVKEEQ